METTDAVGDTANTRALINQLDFFSKIQFYFPRFYIFLVSLHINKQKNVKSIELIYIFLDLYLIHIS